jgi:hypothetical protein
MSERGPKAPGDECAFEFGEQPLAGAHHAQSAPERTGEEDTDDEQTVDMTARVPGTGDEDTQATTVEMTAPWDRDVYPFGGFKRSS